MKFYEFLDYNYYAIIGAGSRKEAIDAYQERLVKIDSNRSSPKEITQHEAWEKLVKYHNDTEIKKFNPPNIGRKKEIESRFNNKIEEIKTTRLPCYVVIDKRLKEVR